MPEKKRKWQDLGAMLKGRFLTPFNHPEFLLYFVFIIVVVGMFGVFSTIYGEYQNNSGFNHRNVILNLASYFIAILSTGAVDLILKKEDFYKKALVVVGLSALITGVCLLGLSIIFKISWAYLVVSIGVLLAWYIWWIANTDNPNLTNDDENKGINPYAPLGNYHEDQDSSTPTPEISLESGMNLLGDLTGLKS